MQSRSIVLPLTCNRTHTHGGFFGGKLHSTPPPSLGTVKMTGFLRGLLLGAMVVPSFSLALLFSPLKVGETRSCQTASVTSMQKPTQEPPLSSRLQGSPDFSQAELLHDPSRLDSPSSPTPRRLMPGKQGQGLDRGAPTHGGFWFWSPV